MMPPGDGRSLLDPSLRGAVGRLPDVHLSPELLAQVRAAPPPLRQPLPGVESSDHPVPDSTVVVRVYRPTGVAGPLPGLYWMHGGGYVLGNTDTDDARFARLCPELGCIGFSVEYRLAPETPYPGPLEDCYDGLRWVHDNAESLGVDLTRLGVGGSSAGGGLAAALGLLTRERAQLPIAFQLLECPMIDDRQATDSSRLNGLAVWSRESNTFGWRSYLGDLHNTGNIPATAAAARATDLTKLPPAYVCVGGADGFRDEDVDYAMRLSQAGVPTDLRVYAGLPHGLAALGPSRALTQWQTDADAWLGRQFAK